LGLEEVVVRYSRSSDLLGRLQRVRDQVRSLHSVQRDDSAYTPYRLLQRLDAATKAGLVRDYEAGTPTTQLTKSYGLSKASVLKLLQDAGVSLRRQGLDDEQTAQAIRLYESGLSLARVGEQVGFGPSSVANALRLLASACAAGTTGCRSSGRPRGRRGRVAARAVISLSEH